MFEEVVNIHELNNSTKIFVGTFLLNLSLESGQINLNKLKLNEVEETEDKTSLELKIRETKYFITFIDEKKVEVFKSLFILKNFIKKRKPPTLNLVEIIFKYSLLDFITHPEHLYVLLMLHDTCLIEKIVEKLEPKLNFSYFKARRDLPILLSLFKGICQSITCNSDIRIILCNFFLLTIEKYDLIICLSGILSQTINIITLDLKSLIFCENMFISLTENISSKRIDLEIEKLFDFFFFDFKFQTDEHWKILNIWIEKYKKDFTGFLCREVLTEKLISLQKLLRFEKDYLLFYEFMRGLGKIDFDLLKKIFQEFRLLFPLIECLNFEEDTLCLEQNYINSILLNEQIKTNDLEPVNFSEYFGKIKSCRMRYFKKETKSIHKILFNDLGNFKHLFERLSEPPFGALFVNYLLSTNFIEFLFARNFENLDVEFFKYKILHNLLLINSNVKLVLKEKGILGSIKRRCLSAKTYFTRCKLIGVLIDSVISFIS
ncbi:hypothetical protein CDIK_1593 [Cucumispora dikerogammari]|nr:hypothetical protein CDIK_1593 [Cucumispora dikerogammari]